MEKPDKPRSPAALDERRATAGELKPYRPPRIEAHGTIEDLTAGDVGNTPDAFGGSLQL